MGRSRSRSRERRKESKKQARTLGFRVVRVFGVAGLVFSGFVEPGFNFLGFRALRFTGDKGWRIRGSESAWTQAKGEAVKDPSPRTAE